MRRQRMWQLKYRSGSPTDMNVSSSKEGWGTSLLKYINKKFTNLRGKCKEIQLHGETNTIQCQVFQHGERTCRQLCAGAADEVGPVRHSSHPVRLHRWQVWSPQASRPQHLWALSGTGAISNKCWWWFTRCCFFCHFADSVVYVHVAERLLTNSRLQWISATWWIWGKWPRTSQWTCQSTCSGKKPSTPAFFSQPKARNAARYDRRVRPKDHLLHGKDSKGKYITLTPTYAETVTTCPDISENHCKCLLSSCGPRTSSLRTWRTCVVQTTPITSSSQSPCMCKIKKIPDVCTSMSSYSHFYPQEVVRRRSDQVFFILYFAFVNPLISTRYSSRINFDVDCPMKFYKFPFDKQVPNSAWQSYPI